jgi:hypothetical protein
MAEKRTIELEIQDNSKTLKQQYKEAVVELQKVAAAYGETSTQAVEAAKKAAGLKDQIEDTNDLLQSYKGEGAFIAMGKAMSSVASGFSAVEGGLGLLGVESEKLQETMLRVQSAMALAQGLEGLEDAGRAFKNLGTVAMNALKGIRTGIAATGIGLLVIALGTIVAYWDDIKEAVSGVSDEQEALNKKAEENVTIENEKLTALDSQDNILKLQGKSEKQILQLKIKQIDLVIAATEEQIKQNQITAKAQEEATIRNFEIAKKVIAAITKIALIPVTAMIAQIDLLIKGANYVSEALGGGKLIDLEPLKEANKFFDSMAEKGAKLLFDPEQVKADGIKLQEETQKQLTDLKNKRAGYVLAVQQIDKQGSQIDKQGSQTAVDTKKKELDALIELEIKKANTDEKILKDLLDKRLALENLSGAQLELARENNAEKLRKAIDEDNNNLLKQETVKIDKLKILGESRTQTLQGQLNEEVEAERKAAELKTKILEAQAVRAQRIDEQANSFKVKSIQQGLEIVSSITELFGKKSEKQAKRAFQVQKAAQVASALINTYQSATGAYASQFLPVPDPTSPVRGGIAAGLAVAAGLVNVAKIASQKFEGGSTGGGGGTPGGNIPDSQMAAPQFNTIGTSGINQLATLQQQPTKAYVVSGEVTSAQSLDRNRLQNATL